jgi:hypothetical protein
MLARQARSHVSHTLCTFSDLAIFQVGSLIFLRSGLCPVHNPPKYASKKLELLAHTSIPSLAIECVLLKDVVILQLRYSKGSCS